MTNEYIMKRMVYGGGIPRLAELAFEGKLVVPNKMSLDLEVFNDFGSLNSRVTFETPLTEGLINLESQEAIIPSHYFPEDAREILNNFGFIGNTPTSTPLVSFRSKMLCYSKSLNSSRIINITNSRPKLLPLIRTGTVYEVEFQEDRLKTLELYQEIYNKHCEEIKRFEDGGPLPN